MYREKAETPTKNIMVLKLYKSIPEEKRFLAQVKVRKSVRVMVSVGVRLLVNYGVMSGSCGTDILMYVKVITRQ